MGIDSIGQNLILTWWWRLRKSHEFKIITTHPLGTMNICTKQPIQWFSRYFNKNKAIQHRSGARGKARGSSKSFWFMVWDPWMSVQSLMAIHPIVVEIFQPGPTPTFSSPEPRRKQVYNLCAKCVRRCIVVSIFQTVQLVVCSLDVRTWDIHPEQGGLG